MRLLALPAFALLVQCVHGIGFARDWSLRYSDNPEDPVSSFARGTEDVQIEQVLVKDNAALEMGRPLRHYNGLQPVSNRLNASIERVSNLGQSLTMKCASDLKILKCTWTHPKGKTFNALEPLEG